MCYINFGSKQKIFMMLSSTRRWNIMFHFFQLFNVSMHKYITYNLELFGFHALFADFNNNLWAAKQRVMHIVAMYRQTNTQELRQPRSHKKFSFSIELHVWSKYINSSTYGVNDLKQKQKPTK